MTAVQQSHYLYKELQSLLNRKVFDFMHEGSLEGVLYWDLTKQDNMWLSPNFWSTLGYPPNDMAHLSSEWKRVIFQEDLETAMEKIKRLLQNDNHSFNQVIRYEHKNGTTIFMRTRAMAIRNKDGRPLRIFFLSNNISTIVELQEENKRYKEKISYLEEELIKESTHDELTHAYNRRGLEEHYRYLIEVAKRDGSYLSVALFSIEVPMEHYGPEKYNKIVKAFNAILSRNTRHIDVVGRFMENEFMLLLPNTTKENSLLVVDRVQDKISQFLRVQFDEVKIYVGVATKGLNLSDNTQASYDILNLYVDEALHNARKNERSAIVHYQNLHNALIV